METARPFHGARVILVRRIIRTRAFGRALRSTAVLPQVYLMMRCKTALTNCAV